MQREYASFPTRKDRTNFLIGRFGQYLTDSVLDVGCYEAPMRNRLPGVEYLGIDIAGNPDVEVNLEETDKLPFDDNQFHTVVCIEVLEHIDNLHAIYNDLFRVSSQYVIVSLPNCWCGARKRIERGRGSFAHYGLPMERPVDRHKWFFSTSQVGEFLTEKAEEVGANCIELITTERKRNPLVRSVRHAFFSNKAYNNRYCNTVFAVYEKNTAAAKRAA